MRQAVARIAVWPWWGQLALITALGALGALAHAPFDLPPFIFVPLFTGFVLLNLPRTTRQTFWRGWALGWGYFALTLTWIVEPFMVDAAVTGWMAPFALVLLAALLGVFWALALAAARWAGGRAVALIVAWTGAEMLRAYIFTGFPWASPPQALVDVVGGQALAWLGPYGTLMALLACVALALAAQQRLLQAVAIVAISATQLPLPYVDVPMTGQVVRLVQPNAPQDEKWDPALIPSFVNRQIDYIASGEVPDLILLPETALPYLVEHAQPVFDVIGHAARGAPVVLGIQRRDAEGQYYNSAVALDAAGTVVQTYDKHHLVPFGEYMPAAWLFRRISVSGLAQRAERGYAAGPGPELMDLGPLGLALPLICYEAVFAHDVRGTADRPDFLMQLTNDAWFGARSGPQQHLAQARMRAIEQGLPLMRAANTGISAMIDPQGRIVDSLPLNTAGYVDVGLPSPAAPTLYARTGDLPLALLLAGAVFALLRQHRLSERATKH